MNPQPSLHYQERLSALDNVVRHCILVSQASAGIHSLGANYYASFLFTSLCSRGVSLLMLAPHSTWANKTIEHWDFSSLAGITRSILEVRLAFFYLCAEQCSVDEWQCRWNLFNLHDCTSRMSLFQNIPGSDEQLNDFLEQSEKLRLRLTGNDFFTSLPQQKRNKLIKGESAYLSSLEDIAVRAGVDLQNFRLLYKLFSSQVHGLPMSFYRMDEQNRGRGVHSDAEEGYSSLCLSFAVTLLVGARDEMKTIFPIAKDI